jgi:hypothetical protein
VPATAVTVRDDRIDRYLRICSQKNPCG